MRSPRPPRRPSKVLTRTTPVSRSVRLPGIQFIDIPEFPDLGTKVSQLVSSAIAGQMTVDEALDQGQKLAEAVSAKYKK